MLSAVLIEARNEEPEVDKVGMGVKRVEQGRTGERDGENRVKNEDEHTLARRNIGEGTN